MEESAYIPPREAAALTGIPVGTLAAMRYEGHGPRFYKPTPRRVLYKRVELIEWVDSTGQTKTGGLTNA